MNKQKVIDLTKSLIEELDQDSKREGLIKTPQRVAEAWDFITSGYKETLENVVNGAIFNQEVNNMVVVKDIELYSTCEHHLLPFFGKCHIGYIARGKVLGISKLARVVDMYARRLQLQERLTEQIANAIMEVLNPSGVGVVIEAQHLCMMMRGVEKQNSVMVTSSVLGMFRSSATSREEFLSFVRKTG